MTADTQPVEDLEGRELDKAVAGEVMGWEPFDGPPDHVKDDWLPEYPDQWYRRPGGGWENATNVPAYSTDIAAAWGVVDEMIGAPDYAVAFNVSPWPDGGWLAGFCITHIDYAREQGLPIAQFSDEELYARAMVSRGGESLEWDLFNGWGGIGAQAHGIDAPHAICRTALRAVRDE